MTDAQKATQEQTLDQARGVLFGLAVGEAKKETDGLSEEIRLLERIDQLRRSGAITVKEFNRLKRKILGT